jgi:NodT family efflux transporter outer membrane factor (OMF) lipoprotein
MVDTTPETEALFPMLANLFDIRKLRSFYWIVALLAASTLSGCALFAPEPRLPGRNAVPESYSNQAPAAEIDQRWWKSFHSDQLNALVQEALSGNFSLKESWARLRQVEALAIQRGAERWPGLSVEAGASGGGQLATQGNGDTTYTSLESYRLGVASTYEIDLWGSIRSKQQAAILSASASREDLNAAAISLAANVTTRWIGVMSQRMQKMLLQRQLEANLTVVDLLELRFRKSLASALDVFQQRQVVEQVRAQLPLAERQEQRLLNELTLLLGRMPFKAPNITSEPLTIPRDLPVTGLPIQLLSARPDIRAALLRLEAADWSLSGARADRLPAIRLTGSAAYQAGELDALFDNWLFNLAAGLTVPLIDGRRLAAEVDRQRAVAVESLAAYRRTILNAVREVEDALVDENKLREHLAGLDAQLSAARSALDEARQRYRSGLNDYLPVLTQLLSVQNLERTIISRTTDLLIARVDLYRALGGGWPQELESGVDYH